VFLRSNPRLFKDVAYDVDNSGRLKVRFDFRGTGCLIGLVFSGDAVLIDWFFIDKPDLCKQEVDWSILQ